MLLLPAVEDGRQTASLGACPPRESFSPGEVVALRYRIVRLIARGGMGEVYEVEDLELRTRAALKTLRADLADDPLSLDRFRRELQLQRQVTHPNVCRVFDIGRHLGKRGPVLFLTMELLDGESLLTRIRREGPLPLETARPIVRQLLSALEAAHARGIVHRDFKTENVLLVAGESGLRAVVTDFGLARSRDAFVSGAGPAGTPAYMAPEQLAGGEVTAATDVWAIGAVLYEILTGKRPYDGFARDRRPIAPRQLQRTLDARWEAAILRCLAIDPRDRFASARALREALDRPPPRRTNLVIAAAVLAIAATATPISWRRLHHAPAARRTSGRPAVAVLGFRPDGACADAAWLGTALTELTASELAVGDRLRRVPAQSVSQLTRDLRLEPGAALDEQTRQRVQTRLGADYLVRGEFAESDGSLRIDVRLSDARTGTELAEVSERGAAGDLFQLMASAGAELRARLGGPALDVASEAQARRAMPAGTEAMRAYSEGLARLRVLDALGARERLLRAAALEPGFPLTHAALAEVWQRLGHRKDEQAEARRAFESASRLLRVDQLQVEARYRQSVSEWPRALEIWRSLVDFYPESIEYALSLAETQVLAEDAKGALTTLESLRGGGRVTPEDPRVDLLEARARQQLGEFRTSADRAASAARKAHTLGAHELAGEALLRESYGAMTTGDRARGARAAEEAWRVFSEVGDARGANKALVRRGNCAWAAGNLPEARRLMEAGVSGLRTIGDDLSLALGLMLLGGVYHDQGHLADATRAYEEALALYRSLGDRGGEAGVLTDLGQQLAHEGRLDEAAQRIDASIALSREVALKQQLGIALESKGALALHRGDLPDATRALDESLAVYRAISDETGVGNDNAKQATLYRLRGQLDRAATIGLEAVGALDRLGEKTHAAEARLALAAVRLDQHRPQEAVPLARAALAAYVAAEVTDGRARALAVLARALAADGNLAEAEAVAAQAMTADPHALDAVMAAAQVDLAAGHAGKAVERLEAALPAGPAEPLEDRLAARLVLAEAYAALGQTARALAERRAATDEARRRGMILPLR
jgi:tetratricopeptide (TPR) repeat protein/tRNA A-37 threonylcarbamoyl transferase component Bud32